MSNQFDTTTDCGSAPDRPERPLESIRNSLSGLYERTDKLIGIFTGLLVNLMGERPETVGAVAKIPADACILGNGDISTIQVQINDLKIMIKHLEKLAADLQKVI
jgi:hypothetical protein